jgi:hypothetical protein
MSSFGYVTVVLVKTDVSVECIASIIRVTRIGELETKLAITSNRSTLFALVTFLEIVVFHKNHRRHIPEDGALKSGIIRIQHVRKLLKT